ncbi:orotidine-5'-phosphate decarboxylase [bacterium DOLZORAL124_64_63]|nr:MAG: orotidine-5'-phosphate decarboxylase [bacterium DOLZORAL124_64_63]
MNREKLIAHLRALPAQRRIITALDVPGRQPALDLARRLGTGGGFVKVGLELFSAAGPEVVTQLRALDRNIFLDLKYHDIPNTVASAARRAAAMGASLCTMHAQAGRGAMTAAARALAEAEVPAGAVRPALLAVTVLTSLSEDELQETRPSDDTLDDAVVRLARLAWDCGCDGVVCSAADLPRLRAALGPDILTVTPGIRMPGGSTDDQHRITTPRMAVESGADFLVVGRPITKADDPAAALTAIAHHMENGG